MLYLPQRWVSDAMQRRGLGDASVLEGAFHSTLTDDPMLATAIQQAFLRCIRGKAGWRAIKAWTNC